jgi:hypothetical protein
VAVACLRLDEVRARFATMARRRAHTAARLRAAAARLVAAAPRDPFTHHGVDRARRRVAALRLLQVRARVAAVRRRLDNRTRAALRTATARGSAARVGGERPDRAVQRAVAIVAGGRLVEMAARAATTSRCTGHGARARHGASAAGSAAGTPRGEFGHHAVGGAAVLVALARLAEVRAQLAAKLRVSAGARARLRAAGAARVRARTPAAPRRVAGIDSARRRVALAGFCKVRACGAAAEHVGGDLPLPRMRPLAARLCA